MGDACLSTQLRAGDGAMKLLLVRGSVSRFRKIEGFLEFETGKAAYSEFVEVIPCTSVDVTPLHIDGGYVGNFAVDGEGIGPEACRVALHSRAVRIRGAPDCENF